MDSKAIKGKEKMDTSATKAQPSRPTTRAASSSHPTVSTSLAEGESRIESLRSNKGYQYASTPGDSRSTQRRAASGPEIEHTPMRDPSFAPPDSRPVTSEGFQYPPSQQKSVASPVPARPETQQTVGSVAYSSSAVPAASGMNMQPAFASSTAQSAANDPLGAGNPMAQSSVKSTVNSLASNDGLQSLDIHIERVPSVATESTGYAGSFIESFTGWHSRRHGAAA
ncbi:hypothetical protein BDZ89DRAFT_1129554 [Hymenopellis radicata]|nr:hypothetical protein BDZ89DRAFT_1129554 [Hymenopellis radicata]